MRQIQKWLFISVIIPISVLLDSCTTKSKTESKTVLVASNKNDRFADYWYKGAGEINIYSFEQSRYGEMRKGHAVMVFVTEPFSKSEHVKLNNPEAEGGVTVLKLNHIRRFTTGIYDYSMMQSVFTPINLAKKPNTLKLTTTSQDWCGHTFIQTNLVGEKYEARGFSYFESEGDDTAKLKAEFLEDELWSQIRINPDNINEGTYHFIPSNFYTRLSHDKLSTKQARIRKQKGVNMNLLILEYLHLDRTLTIGYSPNFPFKILYWTEEQNGETFSKGKLKASIQSAYWKQNGNQYEYLRDSLGI